MPKNAIFFECEFCDFKCSKKSNYNTHVLTDKHKILTNTYVKDAEIFECYCGKKYKHRQSLYNHKKICKDQKIDIPEEKEFSKAITENLVLRNENKKLVDKLINIAEEPKTVNNKMTINMYLNDKCGDAIDFIKFIEDIEVSRDQLMYTKENGLAKSVSQLLINGLKEMGETERPIHCTDRKRQQFYIKDGDWKKDNVEDTVNKAVYGISHKHFAELEEWDKDHPNLKEDSNTNETYFDIAKQCANTKDEAGKNTKKVMKAISDSVQLKINDND